MSRTHVASRRRSSRSRGVAKTYDNGTQALAPVDLDVARGEFVTLLGPSGCGKTTLLNLVAGLSRRRAARFAGGATRSRRRATPGRRIAFVFQSPTLMPWARVADERAPAARPRRRRRARRRRARRRRARAASASREFAAALPRELSGGMQMRASIARALVTAARPAADGRAVRRARRVHAPAARRRAAVAVADARLTVVFVTHSIHEAVFLSTRVVVMAARPGRIIADVRDRRAVPARRRVPRVARAFAAATRSSCRRAGRAPVPQARRSRDDAPRRRRRRRRMSGVALLRSPRRSSSRVVAARRVARLVDGLRRAGVPRAVAAARRAHARRRLALLLARRSASRSASR